MDKKFVDCRGLSCPLPVLKTKEAAESMGEGIIEVLVDNTASRENVRRFAEKMGFSVDVFEEAGVYRLVIEKKGKLLENISAEDVPRGWVVLLSSTYVGEDVELGKIILRGFLEVFASIDPPPARLVLINAAVKLACGAEKDFLNLLRLIEKKGTQILCCATCLEYFRMLEKLEVGTASNAMEIVRTLLDAEKLVKL